MAPRRPETSRQTETVIQTPSIQNHNVNPQISTTQNTNLNLNAPITNNNSDIKALLSTTVQCLIQLLNAMNTTPAIANNFDTVNSAQADANRINDRPTSNENYRAFGGTLILIKNSIKHYSLLTPSMQTIEATIVILTPIDHDPISIVSIYIPPRSDEYTFTIDIENLIQTSSNCVLFGDFNAPHTAWNCNTNSSRGVRLLDYVNMTNLYIAYPDSPTRFGINSANTLDIAVIRNFYYPYTINSLHDLSSDHNPVLLNFTLKLKKDTPNPRAVHTNWPLFSKHLNTKLSLINYHPNSIKTSTDIDQKISEFTETVRAAHSHAFRPIETLRKSYTPPHIHNLIKQKNQYRNLYHRTLDPHYKTLYNRAQKNVKNELRKYSNENWSARLKALDTQDNSLWAVQNFLKNKRSDIPPLNCSSGTAVTDTQKANILAESILDNFTENSRPNNDFDNDDELINNTVNTFLSLPTSTTTETAYPSEIISCIKKSNSKKAPGKNKNIPSSYRPISLLSTLSKITESIILTRLKEFLYTNNIINPNQYGFTNKLSTLHPLLNLTEAISEGFQSKKSTGAVFLDIQKAFDRVWLTGLTYKLINYKIPPPLVFLLHSYNSNRSYQVRVKDTLSTTKFINCGVAQGSLLGPLLFNLYINDIPEYSLTKLNMYADDTAVHTTFKRITSVTFALNKHLKLLENYYDRWKISINVEKSAAVLFTKKRKIPPPPKMYNTTIPWSQTSIKWAELQWPIGLQQEPRSESAGKNIIILALTLVRARRAMELYPAESIFMKDLAPNFQSTSFISPPKVDRGPNYEKGILKARLEYVRSLLQIEIDRPSPTPDVRLALESELKKLEPKWKTLEGKMTELLPRPIALSPQTNKPKRVKRSAAPVVKPAKSTKPESTNDPDFVFPKKTMKNTPVTEKNDINTNNSFEVLDSVMTDVEDVTPAYKTKPIFMKIFDSYNLVLQDLHRIFHSNQHPC
ncbi:RNA-directed DNA polymerase from mobile element jockey [Trichonephila clavipes]|nr:RNA-directed DNA polymerase from mobile element jockey [Trichonephila clavipes]